MAILLDAILNKQILSVLHTNKSDLNSSGFLIVVDSFLVTQLKHRLIKHLHIQVLYAVIMVRGRGIFKLQERENIGGEKWVLDNV